MMLTLRCVLAWGVRHYRRPAKARRRAVELIQCGYALAAVLGVQGGALVQLWIHEIVPLALVRAEYTHP